MPDYSLKTDLVEHRNCREEHHHAVGEHADRYEFEQLAWQDWRIFPAR